MSEPLLLCLETATEICSIGLSRGEELLAIRESHDRNDHAAFITTYIAECMQEAGIALADISAVAVSGGPGSYTSLRIGLSTAKGICYALEKPLIAVDTLAALARRARHLYAQPGVIYAPMIDARRMEVYMGLFDENLQPLQNHVAAVLDPALFDAWPGLPIISCGNGAPKALEVFSGIAFEAMPIVCSAAYLLAPALEAYHKGDFADLAYYEPFYLKPPNITTPRKGIF